MSHMEGKSQKPMYNLHGYECCTDYRWNKRRFMQKSRQRHGGFQVCTGHSLLKYEDVLCFGS